MGHQIALSFVGLGVAVVIASVVGALVVGTDSLNRLHFVTLINSVAGPLIAYRSVYSNGLGHHHGDHHPRGRTTLRRRTRDRSCHRAPDGSGTWRGRFRGAPVTAIIGVALTLVLLGGHRRRAHREGHPPGPDAVCLRRHAGHPLPQPERTRRRPQSDRGGDRRCPPRGHAGDQADSDPSVAVTSGPRQGQRS